MYTQLKGKMSELHEAVREETFNYVKNVGNTYDFFWKTGARKEIQQKISALFEVIIQLKYIFDGLSQRYEPDIVKVIKVGQVRWLGDLF
jgi:hypothetical protein